jgi:hypothetical protein
MPRLRVKMINLAITFFVGHKRTLAPINVASKLTWRKRPLVLIFQPSKKQQERRAFAFHTLYLYGPFV